MERRLRPLISLVALSLLILALLYVSGYFALSFPYSGPNERVFGAAWQYTLYTPLLEIECGLRGDGFRVGWQH
jgi:hypothetical protein